MTNHISTKWIGGMAFESNNPSGLDLKIDAGPEDGGKGQGYRPKALTFDEELQKAADKTKIRLKTTNPKHLGNTLFPEGKADFEIRTKAEPYRRPDDLNIDREMAEMLQNNVLYEATVSLLTKRFAALKLAIDAGRR